MLTMRIKKFIVGVTVLAAPVWAMAQSPEQLVQKYTPLVGTVTFAKSLVNGLRNGTEVDLGKTCGRPTCAVKFTPPTGNMGFGNVDNALTLAQESLASLGIVTGTPGTGQRAVRAADVRAVLMGPPYAITTAQGTKIQPPGILLLRSQNTGWGEIAQQLNVKL